MVCKSRFIGPLKIRQVATVLLLFVVVGHWQVGSTIMGQRSNLSQLVIAPRPGVFALKPVGFDCSWKSSFFFSFCLTFRIGRSLSSINSVHWAAGWAGLGPDHDIVAYSYALLASASSHASSKLLGQLRPELCLSDSQCPLEPLAGAGDHPAGPAVPAIRVKLPLAMSSPVPVKCHCPAV
ncbi:hypothetical protein Tco_1547687 [Tanacetum coccineum]